MASTLENTRQTIIQAALVAAAIAFLYFSVIAKLARDWWSDENYSHGLLVPFVIGFIIWKCWDELKETGTKPRTIAGAAIIGFAILLLTAGTLGAELFTQRISLVVLLAGIVVYFFGTRFVALLAVPFVLLLLAIPIPQILFNRIAFPLQIWASQMAVWGIRTLGFPTVRNGNVIDILPRGATQTISLEVVEACSGIRSLMTLVTLALALAYFTREREKIIEGGWPAAVRNPDIWRAFILTAAAVPVAVLTNAARVTGTGVLTYYYGKQATESTWHEISGWLVYLVALILLIGANFVLKEIFRRFANNSNVENPY